MGFEVGKLYPGEDATACTILDFACQYRKAADQLLASSSPKQSLSSAPGHFLAIQTIELFLNAALLHLGHSPKELRAMSHDLSQRASLFTPQHLKLQARTIKHLQKLSENREYLVIRYAPDIWAPSQLNEIKATLKDVAKKTTALIKPQ